MDFSLERLRIEQIVMTERYCRDSAQWEKMRTFWHPDAAETNLKITWFNGTIEGHIAGSRVMAEKKGLGSVRHVILPVDVTSTCIRCVADIVHGDKAVCEAYGQRA
jgi:hypothetical protein